MSAGDKQIGGGDVYSFVKFNATGFIFQVNDPWRGIDGYSGFCRNRKGGIHPCVIGWLVDSNSRIQFQGRYPEVDWLTSRTGSIAMA